MAMERQHARVRVTANMFEAVPRPYPETVELIPTLGALFPRGGPVQDPVLTHAADYKGFYLITGRLRSGVSPRQALRALSRVYSWSRLSVLGAICGH